jgi:hypothetical protein
MFVAYKVVAALATKADPPSFAEESFGLVAPILVAPPPPPPPPPVIEVPEEPPPPAYP